MGKGIDYGMGRTNIDRETGIRFGVINMNALSHWAWDDAEPDYGQPTETECGSCGKDFAVNCDYGTELECPYCGEVTEVGLPDFQEPIGHNIDSDGLKATIGEDNDAFVLASPFFTRAQFCSPCAPGACHLESPDEDGERAYCFGHDWFEGGVAPYPVYSVATGELVQPEGK